MTPAQPVCYRAAIMSRDRVKTKVDRTGEVAQIESLYSHPHYSIITRIQALITRTTIEIL